MNQITDDRKLRILKERAAKLAQFKVEGQSTNDFIEVVEFQLENEKYAFESIYVKEVYPLKDLTKLPGTPSYIYGLINVRRKIFSIIDLRVLFDLPIQDENANLNKAIILKKDEMEFAILAGQILGVQSIPQDKIQATLPTLTGLREEFLKGITTDGIVILDAKKMLMSEKIIVKESVSV